MDPTWPTVIPPANFLKLETTSAVRSTGVAVSFRAGATLMTFPLCVALPSTPSIFRLASVWFVMVSVALPPPDETANWAVKLSM